MEKHDTSSVKDLAKKLSALDNEVKLKILMRLVQEGAKSITDISKELKLTFSTTHKYLEQLEAAGLVTSKQVTENRLKRLFYVKDFEIDLSPKGLAEIGKTIKKHKAKFRLFNECGELVDFDEKTFAKKYTACGLPYSTTEATIEHISEEAYGGITLFELRALFNKALYKQLQNIKEVHHKLNTVEAKRTFSNLLKFVHKEALQKHMEGDIFIQNLTRPTLLNFSHDLRGITTHGVTGKSPKNLNEFFSQIIEAIKFTNSFARPVHAIDSINYMSAPFFKEDTTSIVKFLKDLNDLQSKIYLGIDIGLPQHLALTSTKHFMEKDKDNYSCYLEQAELIGNEIINQIKAHKYPNIQLVIKLWGTELSKDTFIKNAYYAKIDSSNSATFLGDLCRFSDSWRKWMGIYRIGEAQNIVLNVPRVALKSKSKKEFKENLILLVDNTAEYIYNMVELFTGEYIRKYNTRLPSPITKKWNYISIGDCQYSISLTGFPEAIKLITGHDLKTELKFAKELLAKCNQHLLEKTTAPLRITLKEDTMPAVAKRFYKLDSEKFNLDVPKYTQGICNSLDVSDLQKQLPGGSCIDVNGLSIDEINATDFSLIKII